jgi:sugar phosphate permease
VLLSWMPKFLYDRFHMGLAMSGLTATVFVQLASMAGAPVGGWLADLWRRRSPRGRMAVQTVGVLGGAPFVVLCGMTASGRDARRLVDVMGVLQRACTTRNIFASAFDVVPPEARGRTAGFMNMIGWLAGGGSAPLAIGVIAERTKSGRRPGAGIAGVRRRRRAADRWHDDGGTERCCTVVSSFLDRRSLGEGG